MSEEMGLLARSISGVIAGNTGQHVIDDVGAEFTVLFGNGSLDQEIGNQGVFRKD